MSATIRISAATLLGLSLVAAAALPCPAEDWNQWRGAARDGVARECPPLLERLPETGLKPRWLNTESFPKGRNGGWSSPAVAGGRVFVFAHQRTKVAAGQLPPARFPYLPPEKRTGMSDKEYEEYERNRRDEQQRRAKNYRFDETVYCVNAETGTLEWKNDRVSVYTRFAQSSTPAVVDGRVYVLGAGRVARCIDAKTGKDVWQRALPGEFRDQHLQSSFAVADGVAVVLCGQLFGLNAGNGEVSWLVGEESSRKGLHSSPVIWRNGSTACAVANLDGKSTVCVELATGRTMWTVRSDAGHATPVVHGDLLLTYGSSRKKGLRCFRMSGEGAELLWTYQGTADPGSSPVVVDGHVFVQGDRRLACVDLETGKAAWMTMLDLNRPRYTSLIGLGDRVIYAFDGVLGFRADSKRFTPWFVGKIDKAGRLAEEAVFRNELKIAELERTAAGQEEAERTWRRHFNNAGPLACASPAVVDGRLYLRLNNGLACYDLRR